MLNIGLGHPRFLTDLNLFVQIANLIIIFVSIHFKNKGRPKHHGAMMGIAVVLHFLTFILVMGPIFSNHFTFFSIETNLLLVQTTWFHAVPGAVALIMAILLVMIWVISPSKTAGCYKRKSVMDITLVLWLFSLTFGIVTYILFYL